jgi:hypothetical protein
MGANAASWLINASTLAPLCMALTMSLSGESHAHSNRKNKIQCCQVRLAYQVRRVTVLLLLLLHMLSLGRHTGSAYWMCSG